MRPTAYVVLLSGAMLAFPLTSALAQSNNPAGNYGSNRSSTASGVTADRKPGLKTSDVTKNGHNPTGERSTIDSGKENGNTAANSMPNITRQAQTTGGPGR